jgi:hypothetical protein
MSDAIKEIEGLLEAEVAKERAANAMTMKVGGGFALFVACYLGWMTWNINTLVDPEGLALAASGFAGSAVPEASGEIRKLVIDGAPDLVRMGSDQVIDLVPVYRAQLEEELYPVIDEVCTVLANAAVSKLASSGGSPDAAYSSSDALQAGADAAVARVDALMEDAMDLPDDEGVTARQRIGESLKSLEKIDKQLKIINKKGGDPAERELLVAWLGLVSSHVEENETAMKEDYKAAAKAPEAKKPDAPPAEAPKADAPAPQ